MTDAVTEYVMKIVEKRIAKANGLAGLLSKEWSIDNMAEDGKRVSELNLNLRPIQLTDTEYNEILRRVDQS